MKTILSLIFVLVLPVLVVAQSTYGNEWIKEGQSYLKVKVGEDGFYRISYAQLQAMAFLSNNPDPTHFQLFLNGKEVPIFIQGEEDGRFDQNDYILFLGTKNKGQLDKALYKNPAWQPNEEISLYDDHSYYFFTYSAGIQGKRFKLESLNPGGLSPLPYLIYTASQNFVSQYYPGAYILEAMSLSDYTEGEGYMGETFGLGASQNQLLNTPFKATQPLFSPFLEFYVAGRSNAQSTHPNGLNHHLQVSIGSKILKDTIYRGYGVVRGRSILDLSDLESATQVTFKSVNDLGALTDFQVPAYCRITYPRKSDLSGLSSLSFRVNTTQSTALLRFTSSTWQSGLLADTAGRRLYRSTIANGVADFVISNPGNTDLFVANESEAKTATLEKVSFDLIKSSSIHSDLLILTHASLLSSVNEYAEYKSQKGFSPLVITMDNIFNQFYYGQHHPLAIKNFLRYALSAQQKPEYLLLIGKGLEHPKFSLSGDLIPTFGYPASDASLSSQIIDNTFAQSIATGRIPAKTDQEVRDYLAKLKVFDNLPPSLSRKNLIHVTGGRDAFENSSFTGYLKSFETIAKAESLGASVQNFNKNVSDPVTDNLTEKIVNSINSGAGMLSFLGHGSTIATEVSLGSPGNYLNNRLLFYLINGCSTGNAFTTASMGETYIFQKDKGAIGWMGTTSEGIASYLSNYSNSLYKHAFKTSYGASMAKCMLLAAKEFQRADDLLNRAHVEQYTYLGDPTLRMYAPEKPDYEIRKQDIFLQGTDLTASSPSIKLGIIVKNPGKAVSGLLSVSVKRILANGSVIDYPAKDFNAIYNTDTLDFTLPNEISNAAGNNQFIVSIDPFNKVDELSEANNQAIFEYFLPSNGITIISPLNYAIESNPNPVLRVQQNKLLSDDAKFIFEIDTLKTFDSPWKKSSGVLSSNLFCTWQPSATLENNKVYYWRAKLAEGNEAETAWRESSFTYISGSGNGWSQGHYQQFDNITLDKISLTGDKKSFEYALTSYPVTIRTRGDLAPSTTERAIRVSTSGGKLSFNTSEFQGLALVAIGPTRQNSFINYPSRFNYKNDGINGTGQYYFNPTIPEEADSLLYYLNHIPDGYFVLGMSGVNFSPKDLSPSLQTALESIGLIKFHSVGPGEPYAFSGKKGALPGSATELTAEDVPAREQTIFLTVNLPYPFNSGNYISETIGPAREWKKLFLNFRKEGDDTVRGKVIGLGKDGTEKILLDQISGSELDLSSISASLYPFIKVNVNTTDPTNFDPAILRSWRVLYDGYTDITLNPTLKNEFHARSIEQGDSVRLALGISNQGNLASDSILLRFSIIKPDRTEVIPASQILPPLASGADVIFKFSYPSNALADSNILNVTANPKDARDQFSFNNRLNYYFNVVSDKKPPVIDVLFDGQRIINGETVSPKPTVNISVKDSNPFLILNDTTLVEIYLSKESDDLPKRISFSSGKLILQEPGNSTNNQASFLYTPDLLTDGLYTLKVRSKDKSGNYISSNDYEISFEVINEQAISHFLPYPNPFSTSMRFVFKITGEKVPDKIKVQIMTTSGKIVREVLKEELGDLRIGNNISAFAWDGTDEFGDRLANGVYFYRVIIENNDRSVVKHKAMPTDGMFKQNFGKIYLLR